MGTNEVRKPIIVLFGIFMLWATMTCSKPAQSGATVTFEVIQAAAGAISMRLSASERFVTLYDGDMLRVRDMSPDAQDVFSKSARPVGAADDQGAVYYVESVREGIEWRLGWSADVARQVSIAPPAGRTWSLIAAERGPSHAVLVFADDPVAKRTAWAVSIDLDQLQKTAARDLVLNAGFAPDSLTVDPTAERVYWVERGRDRKAVVAAVDAASLADIWTVALTVPIETPPKSPSGSLTLTSDGGYLFAAVGDRRRGILNSDGVYALRPADGTIVFGPSPAALEDVRLQNLAQVVPIPGSSAVALLLVFNLRDDPYKFFRIRIVDVAKAVIVGEFAQERASRAIAVRKSGAVLIAPQ